MTLAVVVVRLHLEEVVEVDLLFLALVVAVVEVVRPCQALVEVEVVAVVLLTLVVGVEVALSQMLVPLLL
jgi:hypothetical protein